MFVAGVLATLLFDFAMYAYKRHVSDKYFAVRANVLEISYAKTLTVKVLVELDHTFVERVVIDGSSSERPAFANATHVGDRIVIWVDRQNQEISLFEPDRPRLFSTLWLTSWTIGLFACLLTGVLVGETVPKRLARK